jgi:hypothetical protein
MAYPTLWEISPIVLISIAGIWARYFLRPYLVEKGKNLASKEDIEELTRKVEGIKAQHSLELERLRSELGRASLIHKAQYETEFRAAPSRRPTGGGGTQTNMGLHGSERIARGTA